jgi:dienelactone hydrolase
MAQHMVVQMCLQVVAVVSALQQRPKLKDLPLYALGASSGGAFALTLTAHLSLTGESLGLG